MSDRSIEFTLGGLLSLTWATVRQPRVIARQLILLDLPVRTLWLILLTVAAISAVIGETATLLLIGQSAADADPVAVGPLAKAGIRLGGLVATVLAVHHIGRMMGGKGRFEDSLALIAWLEVVMIAVQVIQILLLVAMPGLGLVVTLAGLALTLWIFTAFVTEIHGFRNMAMVFVTIVASVLAFSFALSLVLSLFGVTFVGAPGV